MTYYARNYERAALHAHLLAHARALPRPVLLGRSERDVDGYQLRASVYRMPDGRCEVYVGARRRDRPIDVWWWPRPVKDAGARWARELAAERGDVAGEWSTVGTYCAATVRIAANDG